MSTSADFLNMAELPAFIQVGHEGNTFGEIEQRDNGVCYNHGTPSYLPPQISICAAGIRAPDFEVYAPGHAITLLTPKSQVFEISSVPEPALPGLVLVAVAAFYMWKKRWSRSPTG